MEWQKNWANTQLQTVNRLESSKRRMQMWARLIATARTIFFS